MKRLRNALAHVRPFNLHVIDFRILNWTNFAPHLMRWWSIGCELRERNISIKRARLDYCYRNESKYLYVQLAVKRARPKDRRCEMSVNSIGVNRMSLCALLRHIDLQLRKCAAAIKAKLTRGANARSLPLEIWYAIERQRPHAAISFIIIIFSD